MRRSRSGETKPTVDEVRESLALEAQKVMDESKPTPTPADMDNYLNGGHLDDKEESDPPSMPPVVLQQALLAEAAPSEPPPVEPPAGEKPPPGAEPPPLEPVPEVDNSLPEEGVSRDVSGGPAGTYQTRSVTRR